MPETDNKQRSLLTCAPISGFPSKTSIMILTRVHNVIPQSYYLLLFFLLHVVTRWRGTGRVPEPVSVNVRRADRRNSALVLMLTNLLLLLPAARCRTLRLVVQLDLVPGVPDADL